MQLNEAFSAIISGIKDTTDACGFKLVKSDNADGPYTVDGEHSYVDFKGDRGTLRFDVFGNQAVLFIAPEGADESNADSFEKASTNYFNLDEFDQRDIKSLCNELNETLETKFIEKSGASSQSSVKKPTSVSKAAVKAGSQFYDSNTLANRITALYPELKEAHAANYEKYGELLAEEFFEDYGAAPIINTIRNGSDQEMKKLFKILNEVYEDGTSDTQGLIAVTILGKMNNEEKLIERAKDFMCDDMSELVVIINKQLASPKGEKFKKLMKNPPAYKPKKKKQGGLFSQMMAAGNAQGGGMPPTM